MLFIITCVLASLNAVVAVISFILFIRARVKEDEQKEKRYKSIHYTTLAFFTILLIIALTIYQQPD
ncbi:MAG TPA: hypothetical protein VFN30_03690 [Chitinophagaceae bacterium]|nr:hypothetical protein [Chitinophagaceae bacterium]